jgi:hypothetical protein
MQVCDHSEPFSVPFHIKFETLLAEFQMEMIDLQCATDLRNRFTFQQTRLLDCIKICLPLLSFKCLATTHIQSIYLSESIYSGEQFY